LDLAVAFGLVVAAVGLVGNHLDGGRLSQAFGLQGTTWAHDQAWGERWWSYAVWVAPLLTAGAARGAMSAALRRDEPGALWAGALTGLVALLVVGFVVFAGTPGLLSATSSVGRSRLLFALVFTLPVPVLLAAAAAACTLTTGRGGRL
jgi:hypothetical protein